MIWTTAPTPYPLAMSLPLRTSCGANPARPSMPIQSRRILPSPNNPESVQRFSQVRGTLGGDFSPGSLISANRAASLSHVAGLLRCRLLRCRRRDTKLLPRESKTGWGAMVKKARLTTMKLAREDSARTSGRLFRVTRFIIEQSVKEGLLVWPPGAERLAKRDTSNLACLIAYRIDVGVSLLCPALTWAHTVNHD